MSIHESSSSVILPNSKDVLSKAHAVARTRTPGDIIRMAQPATMKQERLLLDLSQLTHDRPEVLPQLAGGLRSRLETGNRAASMREAFERVRLDMHLHMANAILPLMTRVLLYVHLDLNGMVKLIPLPLDETLGMRVSDKKLPGDYAGRLEWCDGRPLSEAPTPTMKKPVQSVRPTQLGLFEVAQ